MGELEKYKIALFMIIRNSAVLPKGLVLCKSMKEINRMSYETMQVIINNTVDFNKAKEMFEEGKTEFEKTDNVGEQGEVCTEYGTL